MNYDLSAIQTNFRSLVGFKNSQDPNVIDLNSVLTTSNSGLYVSNIHSYLTTKNLEAIAPNYAEFDFDTWLVGTTYAKDDKVVLSGVNYNSKAAANTGNAPAALGVWWELADPLLFSEYIQQIYDDTVGELLAHAIGADSLLDDAKIYDIETPATTTELDATKIYGIKLTLFGSAHLRMVLNQIGLYFNTIKANLDIYIHNQNVQVATFQVSTQANRLIWTDVSAVNLDNTLSGDFYIFYKASDMAAIEPIDGSLTWSIDCSRFVACQSFSATEGDDLNNPDNVTLESVNFGLNLNITVKCNLTEFITQNRLQFAESFNYLLATKLLKELEGNPEAKINRNERNIDLEQVRFQLYNADKGSETVVKQLKRAYTKLFKGIGDLNRLCLPCPDDIAGPTFQAY